MSCQECNEHLPLHVKRIGIAKYYLCEACDPGFVGRTSKDNLPRDIHPKRPNGGWESSNDLGLYEAILEFTRRAYKL